MTNEEEPTLTAVAVSTAALITGTLSAGLTTGLHDLGLGLGLGLYTRVGLS